MNQADADSFAAQWARQWNTGDLDGLLAHFADDVVFTSPVAAQVRPVSAGVIRGKDALGDYWAAGLRRIPDLHFEVLAVYAGVATVVINYRNHAGNLVCEVLEFDGDLVVRGHGTYLSDDAAGASGVIADPS